MTATELPGAIAAAAAPPAGGAPVAPVAPSAPSAPIGYFEECLLFLCRHFDVPVSRAAVVSSLVGEERELTLDQFEAAADRVGLLTSPAPASLDAIDETDLPILLPLPGDRAVVLVEQVANGAFAAFHPDFGPREVELRAGDLIGADFARAYSVRPTARAADGGKERSISHAEHWFWGPIKANRGIYLQVVLAAVLTNFLGLATSIFTMVVYDRVIPNNATESLIALSIGMAIALGFDFLIKMLRASFIDDAGHRADMALGARIFDHLVDMQMTAKKSSSGALAGMLREFETLREFFTSASLIAIVDLPFLAFFVAVIAMVAGPMALVPALAIPAVILTGVLVQPLMHKLAKDAYSQAQQKQGVLVETIQGLETIKAVGAAPMMRKRWQNAMASHGEFSAKSRRLTQFAVNATGLIQQAATVCAVIYGVFLIQDNVMTMGALVATVILMGRIVAPLAQIAQTLSRINQVRASYENLDEWMKRPNEREENRHYVSKPRLDGKIEFREVTFQYTDQPVNAVERVSFTIQPGEKVAILGKNGSGKSTLARLMLGLYRPTSGEVLIDDSDCRQIDPADLRNNIGAAMQDVCLFTGSVRQNIAIGARRPTDEEILRAATIAGVHDFIRQHPQGYDLFLSERGEGLSGGQRQAIALARALINDAPILLLDEPTSAMDNQAEQQFIDRVRPFVANKTLIAITHRTALLELVDRVIVLDRGKVVADGPKSILTRNQPIQAAAQRPGLHVAGAQ